MNSQPPRRVICLWSGPRNVSTALMYSFAQRSDTEVVDEPLYGHYLRASGALHPGREAVLAAMDCDGAAVMRGLLHGAGRRPVRFAKQMAHHLLGVDRQFLHATQNVLLLRDPREVLCSLAHQLAEPRLSDTGLAVQVEIYQALEARGQPPAVLDARELLSDPRAVLEALCARLGLAFEAIMLGWPAGPKPFDGVWAPHWYQAVHRSTGFAPYRAKTAPLPQRLAPVLEQCRPLYEALQAHALRGGGGR